MIDQRKEGNYQKFGVQIENGTVIFTFEAEKEDNCAILFYGKDKKQIKRMEVPGEYCIGSVRSVGISGISAEQIIYNYEINGKVMTDAYAERIIGREKWNDAGREQENYAIYGGYQAKDFDWEDDRQPEIPKDEMVMYKLHVRGFSMDAGIRGKTRGTFRAVQEKIPYLKSLGITTLEFMPMYEFEEMERSEKQEFPTYLNWESKEGDLICKELPKGEKKVNYWGYVPGNYFSVKASYSSTPDAAREWKELIRKLHANGMECIMEMYFDERMNQNVILDALRFWVREYHVDGFHLLGSSVPVTAVAQDMLLSRTKIFCEGFDPMLFEKKRNYQNLFVYSDEYLYPVRRMLNHMGGRIGDFLCQQKKQHAAQGFVNYIAGNNGFTLFDLFSYQEKHNGANGEENRDGRSCNYSSNYGAEGRTTKRYICEIRERQLRNAIAILMLGQGVPLLLSGDEFGNSQDGNNNAYCQYNKIGWLNWKRMEKYGWLSEFTKEMISFRRKHPMIAAKQPMQGCDYANKGFPDLSYHGEHAWLTSLSEDRQSVGVMYCGAYADLSEFVYVGYNFHNGPAKLALPKLPDKMKWRLVMDTARGREAFLPEGEEQKEAQVSLKGQAIVILLGKN
ncbi:MAG: alpha-amylase family glycosyl hydrolase [Clostridiales bacterium]|nr:alpha-amylase family glycosyl hydrolase [Clostridiales bacterium]